MRPEFLFVYGTLLSVAEHPMGRLLRESADELGSGFIRARLYLIEEIDQFGTNIYPGAVPSAFDEDRVYGIVYRIHTPEPMFTKFDAYEACGEGYPEPYEFLLRPIDVRMEQDNSVLRAATYAYTWDVSRAQHIASGRFNQVASQVR